MIKTGLVWFRNDLRMADNHSLFKAMSENDQVITLFCFEPRLFEIGEFGFRKTEKFRAKFLIETLTALQENLDKHNITLLTYFCEPEKILPEVMDKYAVSKVYSQKEWTAEELTVALKVKKKINNPEVVWVETYDQFLFHPDDIPMAIPDIPKVFTHFRKQCEQSVAVRPLVSIVAMPSDNRVVNSTKIPTLVELGFDDFKTDDRSVFPFKGGENQALARVDDYFWGTKSLSRYKETRNGLLGFDYSSKLSAWLANGSLSPRTLYFEILKYEEEIEKNDSTYWLIFELIWRDFFKYIAMKHGNDLFKLRGILHKDYQWSTDQSQIQQWIAGETTEDFVNANMRELSHTGWMSNRGRQNVASFFAKECALDWRIGAAYFEAFLIDYDVHSNYGNWTYVAGVGNDPRDRKFNIQKQSEQYDAQYEYRALWLSGKPNV